MHPGPNVIFKPKIKSYGGNQVPPLPERTPLHFTHNFPQNSHHTFSPNVTPLRFYFGKKVRCDFRGNLWLKKRRSPFRKKWYLFSTISSNLLLSCIPMLILVFQILKLFSRPHSHVCILNVSIQWPVCMSHFSETPATSALCTK
jgi:hypothetical protein